MTSSDNSWFDSVEELQIVLLTREKELHELIDKRRIIEKKSETQRRRTTEIELEHLRLVETAARTRRETVELQQRVDSMKEEIFKEPEMKHQEYGEAAMKQTELLRSLVAQERNHMKRFAPLFETYFEEKRQNCNRLRKSCEEILYEIESKWKKRISEKENKLAGLQGRVHGAQQQISALQSQIQKASRQREFQERALQQMKIQAEEERKRLEGELRVAVNLRDQLLREENNTEAKIKKIISETQFLKNNQKTS